jgi:hypothetical protein
LQSQLFLRHSPTVPLTIDELIQKTQNKIETLEKTHPKFLQWEACDLKNAIEMINTWLLKVRAEEFT